jgi:hypothetical protein
MAEASYTVTSFLGGEVSKTAQGRTDDPAYRTWMNVCFNSLPFETGAWTRRPGTMHTSPTRGGLPGRVINFDFKLSNPYSMEFTDGFLRFRTGPILVMTNDQKVVLSISAANPAKVKTTTSHGWATGNQVALNALGTNNPLLQGRLFAATVTSATEFTLTDSITGATINGATLGAFVSGNVTRVLEIATPYTSTLWSTLRAVQADVPVLNATTPGAVLLSGTIKPYVLTVVTPPTITASATFTLAPIIFKDGPYYDPFTNGVTALPSALNGIITITLAFAAYDATRAYSIGDYVTSAGVNYRSLVDGNLGSAPPSANWVAVSAGEAIGPNGFVGTDVGRMVRLYSEPAIWDVAASYAVGAVVAYGGSGLAYTGATYWKSLVAANIGNVPGVDITKWALFPSGAIWTWGKIVSLTNEISRLLAGSVSFTDDVFWNFANNAFDGVFSQPRASCPVRDVVFTGFVAVGSHAIGKNYSGASAQKIDSCTITPPSDAGYFFGDYAVNGFAFTINLRAKATAPASASDGTLLGTVSYMAGDARNTAPITFVSNDKVTAWNYVWVEFAWEYQTGSNAEFIIYVAEIQFFAPPGTGTATGINLQILGDPLLYTTAVRTWRMGLFSDTTGWPSCGTWHEGRLFLSGFISNRWDASKSNDPFNFAPTNPDGTVAPNNAISYTFNAPDLSPIFWMHPEDLGVVCGTQGGEWLVQATNTNLPLTPTSVQAHRQTKYNCANIEPKRTNLTLAIVQTFRRELLEFFPDIYNGKFAAHDLVVAAKHIVATGIAEIGWQQELVPVLWGRCDDGSLFGVTYGRGSLQSSARPDFAAPHRHELGSGRLVESLTVAGNTDGTLDAMIMVTNDDSDVRHVEMLANYFTETDTLPNAWLLDNAVRPTSVVSSAVPVVGAPLGGMTMNGLWHLNGKTVQVFAAGLDCGQGEIGTVPVDFLVTNGSAFVPYGDGVSAGSGSGLFTAAFAVAAAAAGQIVVGFTYDSDGQIVRPNSPQESGARTGPAFAKLRRNTYCGLLVNQTAGLSIGTDFAKLMPVLFKDAAGEQLAPGQTFSGVYRDVITDDDSFDGMICWRVSRPLPATIAQLGVFLQTKDP